MRARSTRLWLVLLVAGAVLAAVCGDDSEGGNSASSDETTAEASSDSSDSSDAPDEGDGAPGSNGADAAEPDEESADNEVAAVDPTLCGLDELADADGPVEITFWHQQTTDDTSEEMMTGLIEAFHESQDAVRVNLVGFGDYEEIFQKWRAGLSTGDIPDLVVMEETAVQSLVDSQSTIPMQSCVDADDYDLSDYLPRAVNYYTTQNALRAMPWNVSNPIFFYDRGVFEAAGLDPDDPPATLEEVREYAQQIVDSGAAPAGMALKMQDHYNEFWFAKGGQVYVDNDNGRAARATAAQLDNEFGLELWTWWKDMVDSGLAISSAPGPDNIDHLLAVGTGSAAMTIEGSGAIGPVLAVLESGQYPGVEMDAAPLPGLVEGGGVPVGDGALWISSDSAPEKRAAAWELVKFLNEPEQQVELHLAAGYVPIRLSAAEDPRVVAAWEEEPIYRVAYDQLVEGPESPATAGSVIGDYQGVRDAVTRGLEELLISGATPADALATTQELANAAIDSYNDRVGG